MIRNTNNMKNRREAPRFNEQLDFSYETPQRKAGGVVLNISQTGARLVVGQRLPARFKLTFHFEQTVELEAERVWEDASAAGGCSVLGVRFTPGQNNLAKVQSWLNRRTHA